MAISFSRPDPSSPAAVAEASFGVARRGFDQAEVRDFLRMVSAEMNQLHERVTFLERELRLAQRNGGVGELDEETVTRLLGEEAARILSTARESAAQIRQRAEEGAASVLREATDEAQRLREEAEIEAARRRADATSDAEAELSMAKQQGREMVNEARAYRERVLGELARRREAARQQIEQLIHGRDRLIQVFERARLVAVDVIAELTPLGGPDEYVNLDPTTGPVPMMVPASTVTARPPGPAPIAEPPAVEPAAVEPAAVEEPSASVEPAADAAEPAADAEEPVTVGEVADAARDAVIAAGTPHREPPAAEAPAPTAEGALIRLPSSDDEAAAEVDRNADVVAFPGRGAKVDDLFARLRAGVDEHPSVDAEVEAAEPGDTVFSRRDADITPLIVSAARKLKRVLADEQNEVLATLRRSEPVRTLDALVPWESEHAQRYVQAIGDELYQAALTGAATLSDAGAKAHRSDIARAKALEPVEQALDESLIAPLRDRLRRCVEESGADNNEVAKRARALYREWKTQRIDEHLDDIVRLAYGRGALAAVDPGTPVRWAVDPDGPPCPDAEDNALAGPTPAGQAFPTGHVCAPAHAGCRCMLVRAEG
jgi:DivIVA domain-containing protein